MKISLISTENFIISHGLRTISACLKSSGHDTRLIFLSLSNHEDLSDYNINILDQLMSLLEGADLIGISSMAISSHRAAQVATRIKKSLAAPLMWGGIYATTCPDECLKFADMVCIGEGEEAVLELVEKMKNGNGYLSTKNFWFKNGDVIVKNDIRPLKENLDELPFADYNLENQYILRENKIIPAREYLESNPNQIHGGQILIHTTRGCPYGCSYCSNHFLNNLYKNKGSIIRKRSFSNVIIEIVQLKKKFPLASSVFITDDVFFLRNIDELEFFSQEYSTKVGIPFQCYVAPSTIREDKLKIALEGGLNCVVMGIQTGSERVNRDIYKRFVSNEAVLKAAQILNKYKEDMIPPTYQFITANPYENSDDLIETIRLLQRLPKPYTLEVANLIFFPGCELYHKAIEDGLISDSQEAKYNIDYYDERRHIKLVKKNLYLNTLIYCMRGNATSLMIGSMPISLIDFFVRKNASRWVNFYLFVLIAIWRLRYIYLKISAVLPMNLRKVISKMLRVIFISIGGLLKLTGKLYVNKRYRKAILINDHIREKREIYKNIIEEDMVSEKNPKVSVIIPTHNHAHFLPECLASVKNQTFKNYEVIVVNNGSTDNTEQVVRNLAWDKLRYYFQQDTGSVSGPRNTGIKLAKGEYIAFLDSDDLWYEQKLEKVMNILEINPEIDVIAHDVLFVREGEGIFVLKTGHLNKNLFKALLLFKNQLIGSATTVKRDVMLEIGGFDENKDFIHVEDYETWLRISYLKKQFFFINEILGEYRAHSLNLSIDFEKVLIDEINVINKHFRNFRSKVPLYKNILFSNRLSIVYFKFGVQYFFRKKYKLSFYNLLKSFSLSPVCFLRYCINFLINKNIK